MGKLWCVFMDYDFDELETEVYHGGDTTRKEGYHHPLIFVTSCQVALDQ